jgi:hypothetical protein
MLLKVALIEVSWNLLVGVLPSIDTKDGMEAADHWVLVLFCC